MDEGASRYQPNTKWPNVRPNVLRLGSNPVNIESVCCVWAHWWIQNPNANKSFEDEGWEGSNTLSNYDSSSPVCNSPTTVVKVRRFYLQKLLPFADGFERCFFRTGSKNHLKHASTDLNYLCDIPSAVDLKQTPNETLLLHTNIQYQLEVSAGRFIRLPTQNEEQLDRFKL